ncbi:MAG: DNA polymerase III subunit delta [Bacteroidetes bacterium]|nr:DNA polymerase III subunit delta [Bacteroidota bacterium]
MLFGEIIGQQEVKGRLLNMVGEDRVPHALMLFGPPGTGKRSLAIAMAQYLACAGRKEHDSCGVCPSCVKFSKLVHPDFHMVVPVLTTPKVSKNPITDNYLEEWREAFLDNPYLSENQWYESAGAENKQGIINVYESESIIKKLGFKPYESEYRLMMIWLPERMNAPTANKLLKLLEEPPEKTTILMVSESTERILPTILSRTQLLHVPPIEENLLREGLMNKIGGDPDLLEDAVRRGNGNFNLALTSLMRDEQELYNFDQFTLLMRLAYSRSIIEINSWVEGVAGIGRERQKQLLDYSLRLLRENFMLHMEQPALNFMSRKEAGFSGKFSPFIHEGNIYGLVESFSLAANHIEANGNPRIIFMDLSIRVIRLLMQKAEA